MRALPERDFLRLAGLAIADRLLPSRLRAPLAGPPNHGRKPILVTFGGGCRYQETLVPRA